MFVATHEDISFSSYHYLFSWNPRQLLQFSLFQRNYEIILFFTIYTHG